MARILVSAAHTSIAPGEVYKGLREFDLTKTILGKVVKELEAQKVEHKAVPVDLNLLNRIDWINNSGYKEEDGDIFIEIHVNDGGKRGIETWFSGDADEKGENNSENLAKKFQEELCKATKYEDQGVKSEHKHELKSLLILNQTNPIAIATELLYIDNDEDRKILQDDKKLDELAKNFVDAVKKYFDSKPKIHPKKPKKNDSPFGTGSLFGGGSSPFGGTTGIGGGATLGSNSSAGKSNISMDREERKKMIEKKYQEILGKEPKQADLNYYLNTGVSEEELVNKIVDSKDFKDIIEDAKEAAELRESSKKSESELIQLRSKIADLNKMHQNYNVLLQHKNTLIRQLQQELIKHNIAIPGQYFDPNRKNPSAMQQKNFQPRPPLQPNSNKNKGGIMGIFK